MGRFRALFSGWATLRTEDNVTVDVGGSFTISDTPILLNGVTPIIGRIVVTRTAPDDFRVEWQSKFAGGDDE